MGSRAHVLLATTVALLLLMATAPAAFAVSATVRVEAAPFTVAAPTKVDVLPTATFYDASGTPYRSFYVNSRGDKVFCASALGALAAAGKLRGFSFEAAYGGDFITNIAGFGALPDYSQGWIYAVNGAGYPVVDVGAFSFRLHKGDRLLFAQYPDGTFTHGTKALVTRVGKKALLTGEALVVTVVGDDLAKANTLAEAKRFGLGADAVETSEQFAPVEGAVIHVGSATYVSDENGVVTVAAPFAGTSRVWAEHDMDTSFAYVRSAQTLVNVADPLVLSSLTAIPGSFKPGQTVRIAFTLSRSATVKYTVRNRAGSLIASGSRRTADGPVTMRWDGRTSSDRAVRPGRYTIRVTAMDTWGRAATPVHTTVVAR